jgi:hypothetical protein
LSAANDGYCSGTEQSCCLCACLLACLPAYLPACLPAVASLLGAAFPSQQTANTYITCTLSAHRSHAQQVTAWCACCWACQRYSSLWPRRCCSDCQSMASQTVSNSARAAPARHHRCRCSSWVSCAGAQCQLCCAGNRICCLSDSGALSTPQHCIFLGSTLYLS